jgi:hypothetical protein
VRKTKSHELLVRDAPNLKFEKEGNNLRINRSVGSLNGLVVFCPTKGILVRELKSILGQLCIPHFDEDKTYIATHQGWNVCPHSVAKKLLQIYHSPHNEQAFRSHDLFTSDMGLQNKGTR